MAKYCCRDCEYFDWLHKTPVGYPCLNFNRWRNGRGKTKNVVLTSDLKAPSTPACKTGFKKREVKKND